MQKKNIAIVCGGDSSEIEVSLKSATGIHAFINTNLYSCYTVVITKNHWYADVDGEHFPIDKNDFSFVRNNEKYNFYCAYITIHGTPGENGLLQGYFELIGMPYSCCSVLPAAITFDKFTCNQYLNKFGVKIAESVLVQKGQAINADEILAATGLPVFVKPNAGGSSFGISKVNETEYFQAALDNAFSESEQVVVEQFVEGLEVTNGIYATLDKTTVLPVTEVVPKNEFFDYEAKYVKGMAEEITPARISEELTSRIQQLTQAIYKILHCKGIVRVDYIIKKNAIYLLEVNTTPGMTATSFIPQQIEAAKLPIDKVFEEIIEDAVKRVN